MRFARPIWLALLITWSLLVVFGGPLQAVAGSFGGSPFGGGGGGVDTSTTQTVGGAKTFSNTITSTVASPGNAFVMATGAKLSGTAATWYTDAIGGGRWISSGGLYVTGAATLNGTVGFNGVGSWAAGTTTVADDGAGTSPAGTLTATGNVQYVVCNDANGCTITVSESGATAGQVLWVINTSANTATFSDTSGVTELTGSAALGQYDTLTLLYLTDRWVEMARSNN